MTGAGGRRVWVLICGILSATAAGCADLDFMPSWMPFQEPASDQMAGVVSPAERIAQVRALAAKADRSSPDERQKVSMRLARSIRDEQDPLIRLEIIRALGNYSGSIADAVLKAALTDADAQVRIAACDAWGKRGGAEAVKLLSESLRGDVDADVRLAAAKALGETQNQAAAEALGEALFDADPAMQYRAMLSLQQATGKDLGDDVYRWQQYVKGEIPEPQPTWSERIRQMF